MPVPGESCASVLNTRPPRHRPRLYHVRSAPSDAPTATTMLAPRLRCPLPASAPAPSRAGITGTGRPPWLTKTHANRSHSRCWRSTGDYPHRTGGRRGQPRRSSAVQSVRGPRQHVRLLRYSLDARQVRMLAKHKVTLTPTLCAVKTQDVPRRSARGLQDRGRLCGIAMSRVDERSTDLSCGRTPQGLARGGGGDAELLRLAVCVRGPRHRGTPAAGAGHKELYGAASPFDGSPAEGTRYSW